MATVAPTARNYFAAFLTELGLPVTQDNLNALYGVAQLEGWNDRYNPLNSIQPEPGSSAFNSVGVQRYADFNTGVKGAADLFRGSHWAGVRSALARGNDAPGVLAAFQAAYTWDPGVQFPMGQPGWGDNPIGPSGGTMPTGGADTLVSSSSQSATTSIANFKFPGQGVLTGTVKDLQKMAGAALGPLGSIIGSPLGSVKTATQGLENIGKDLASIAAVFSAMLWLTQPSSWLRIGAFATGLLLLIIGGYLFATSRG